MRVALIISLFSFLTCPDVGLAQGDLAKAQLLYQESKYPEALALIEDALSAGQESQLAWRIKGDCLQKEEKYVAAIQAYEKAGKFAEESAILEANWGAAYINLGQTAEAEKKLKKALKFDNSLPEAHYFMGNLLYADFNTAAAWKSYNEAVKLRADYRDAIFMRAAAASEREKYGEALADYQRVLEIDPNLVAARFNMAVIRVENELYSEAIADLEAIKPHDLDAPVDYHFYMGEALYFSGRKEDACGQYQLAFKYGDAESGDIYERYCLNKEERKAAAAKRTIRMSF